MKRANGNAKCGKQRNSPFYRVWLVAACLSALPLSLGAQQSQPAAPGQPNEMPATARATVDPAAQGAPTSAPPAASRGATAPPTLTLPPGTVIPVRTTAWLASDKNHPGDTFSAVLEQPLVADGWVVARRGQTVMGRVDVAEKVKGVWHLGVELSELILVDGQQLPVKTQLVQASAGPASPPGRNVAIAGTTTAFGTIIGAAAGGGQGAAIGAGAGLAAGIAAVLATQGRPTVIPPEAVLTFRLDTPLTISTERSQVAFRPVTQADYSRDQDAYANFASRRFVAGTPGYPPPPYYAPYPYAGYGYCYPGAWGCYPYYPGPFYLGFYGGFGFGPRIGFFGRGFPR